MSCLLDRMKEQRDDILRTKAKHLELEKKTRKQVIFIALFTVTLLLIKIL